MSIPDVLRGDYGSWRGLADGMGADQLLVELQPVTVVRPPIEVIRSARRFMVTAVERSSAPHRIEAWVELGTSSVTIVELDDPPVNDLEATLDRYGPPDLVLYDRRFAGDVVIREYVYARRGVTLSVAEPLDDAALQRRVVHVELYPAATSEWYLTTVDRGTETVPNTHPHDGGST